MDPSRFDGFARSISARLTRRAGLGMLAGASLPIVGLIDASGAKGKKITLCVDGKTVQKPKKKAKKLQKRGVGKGACRCGNGGPCTVFLTAAAFSGSEVGGLGGGDAKCQAAANAASLDGTFRAWLSAGSETPGARFTNIAKAGPYRLVANVGDGGNPPPIVAENFNDLLTCGTTCLNRAINRDENGVAQGGNPGVWTGTRADGTASTDTCGGWTSTAGFGLIGSGTSDTALWTENVSGVCAGPLLLYCFQQAT
ncbi:MAG: hypothetical protein KC442_00205 [Thermomicrobiales bacterium]|nr:hypothetical protein [Thermomicrobiales bacterium]